MRNTASTRKHNWGSRGRRGAARASTAMATQPITKLTADSRFRAPMRVRPRTGTPKCSNRYQIEPQSAGRVRLNWWEGGPAEGGTMMGRDLAPSPGHTTQGSGD